LSPAGSIGVRRLATGAVREKRADRGPRRYLPGGWAADTLPVNVFLVEHPEGLCLFDAGQSARAGAPGYLPGWHPFLRLARFELSASQEAGAQLRALGRDPADVRWVVLSHLHTDHAGGLEPFGGSELVVTRTEWELFQGLRGRIRGYLPQYWPAGVEPTLVELNGPPLGPFRGTRDLSSDGTLVLVAMPGHTAGHMGLLVREPGGGYLLAGDAAHSPRELAERDPGVDAFCREHGLEPLLAHDWAALHAPAPDLVGAREGI
jgi:N-acyl homoserine lactone hydrolase